MQNFSKSALSSPSNPRSGSPHRPSPLQRRKIWLNILIYPPRHPAPTTAFVPPLQLRSRPRTPPSQCPGRPMPTRLKRFSVAFGIQILQDFSQASFSLTLLASGTDGSRRFVSDNSFLLDYCLGECRASVLAKVKWQPRQPKTSVCD